jgi:hypothetical protein
MGLFSGRFRSFRFGLIVFEFDYVLGNLYRVENISEQIAMNDLFWAPSLLKLFFVLAGWPNV